jgi:hypothetical protein
MAHVPDSRNEARAAEGWYAGGLTVGGIGFAALVIGVSLLASLPKDPRDSRFLTAGVDLAAPGFAIMWATPFTSSPRRRHLFRAIRQYNADADCPVLRD